MLSSVDLERLIAAKRRDIEKEKKLLGLASPSMQNNQDQDDKEVTFVPEAKLPRRYNGSPSGAPQPHTDPVQRQDDPHESLSPELMRYLRRHTGLPIMLKTGEFSPNNPLIRSERDDRPNHNDVFLGLGEYEERKKRLRKLRQQEYRDYLDQQAKLKQEAAAKKAVRPPSREDNDEQKNESPVRRRFVDIQNISDKVDSGTQCDNTLRPLSIGVQTDDAEMVRFSSKTSSHTNTAYQQLQAERELSPHTVIEAFGHKSDADERPIKPSRWMESGTRSQATNLKSSLENLHRHQQEGVDHRRRSCDAYLEVERASTFVKKSNREKLENDLRHTYMPSIFDAEAIRQRNIKAEKEAAERRQFYQQELRSQILEQQRIREERKAREKMLEKAEMRRLEEQLRMLQLAQEKEVDKQNQLTALSYTSALNYERKRNALQKEIDSEQRNLLRSTSVPQESRQNVRGIRNNLPKVNTSSKLPFYYSQQTSRRNDPPKLNSNETRKPFSSNIPQDSLFSPSYDVESYLRRNLNPYKEKTASDQNYSNDNDVNDEEKYRALGNQENFNQVRQERFTFSKPTQEETFGYGKSNGKNNDRENNYNGNADRYSRDDDRKGEYEPSFLRKNISDVVESKCPDESLSIPVLKYQDLEDGNVNVDTNRAEGSDAMKTVAHKWQVPVVQKNILKALPGSEGKGKNILTQLGSIRRQLQLEQLKLDKMLAKDSSV